MELKNLERAIRKEYQGYIKNAVECIRNGNEYEKDGGIQRTSTATRWEQYQNGTITRAQAVKFASERVKKQYEKKATAEIEKVRECANTCPPSFISIRVEWKRSSVWGMNPTAEVVTGQDYTTGSASGCGYDKESSAVAVALVKQAGIMGEMWRRQDKHPRTPKEKLFGYGSGYGAKGSFEGGVGMNALTKVIESLGYKKVSEMHGKTFDGYEFERS